MLKFLKFTAAVIITVFIFVICLLPMVLPVFLAILVNMWLLLLEILALPFTITLLTLAADSDDLLWLEQWLRLF